jgi:hypothetical protein
VASGKRLLRAPGGVRRERDAVDARAPQRVPGARRDEPQLGRARGRDALAHVLHARRAAAAVLRAGERAQRRVRADAAMLESGGGDVADLAAGRAPALLPLLLVAGADGDRLVEAADRPQERGPPPSISARIGPAKTSRSGVAAAAASSAGSHVRGASTSSSTNTASSPCAACQPALRAAFGPRGSACAITCAPRRCATTTLSGSKPSTTTITSAPASAACGANERSATSR